jgi:hypothetical protein
MDGKPVMSIRPHTASIAGLVYNNEAIKVLFDCVVYINRKLVIVARPISLQGVLR